ncbi:MAG: TlpA family protein disulfide reductase [Chloroflexi bacterium]|nr:TlpA family protein disulfide reductase [Chloroflexota bacterium]
MRWHRDVRRLLIQISLFVTAVACLSTAVVFIIQAGLPERAAFTGQIVTGGRIAAPEIGALAPPLEGKSPDGQTLRLANWRGQPVIVNFWATWCEPCRTEMPQLQALHDRYHDQGLRILAVNLGETPAVVREWVRALGLTFDILLDANGEAAARYQLRGQPSTYVISPAGTVTHIFFGPAMFETLQSAVMPFVAGR